MNLLRVSATPRAHREGAAPGWGKLSTPLPTPGLAQGRTSHTKPASIIPPAVNEISL